MIAVLQGYKEGKPIQSATKGEDNWKTTVPPCWDFDMFDYRIKPEEPKPKYRPYQCTKEVLEDVKKKGMFACNLGVYFSISAITHERIWFPMNENGSDKDFNWPEAFDCFKWPDGTPFGVKEE